MRAKGTATFSSRVQQLPGHRQIYLFVEHVFLLIESLYGHQIRRHFGELEHPNLAGPDFDAPPHDPPF